MTTPEVAAELMSETYSPFFEEVASESSWEMKETASKGMGLFAKRNIKAGETLILKSPALFIARDALDTPSRSRRRLLIETAVKQLPEKTRELVMVLSRRGGQSEYEDIIHTNSHRAKVWDGSSHLVLVPEAAVSSCF